MNQDFKLKEQHSVFNLKTMFNKFVEEMTHQGFDNYLLNGSFDQVLQDNTGSYYLYGWLTGAAAKIGFPAPTVLNGGEIIYQDIKGSLEANTVYTFGVMLTNSLPIEISVAADGGSSDIVEYASLTFRGGVLAEAAAIGAASVELCLPHTFNIGDTFTSDGDTYNINDIVGGTLSISPVLVVGIPKATKITKDVTTDIVSNGDTASAEPRIISLTFKTRESGSFVSDYINVKINSPIGETNPNTISLVNSFLCKGSVAIGTANERRLLDSVFRFDVNEWAFAPTGDFTDSLIRFKWDGTMTVDKMVVSNAPTIVTQVVRLQELNDHGGSTNAHSSTAAATANRIILRDANGRAKVAAPSAADDIARKDTVDTHGNLTTAHGAVSAATADRIIIRDAAGRAKVAAPGAADDIARQQEIYDHASVTATHGALSTNSPERIIIRDSSGRAKVTAGIDGEDIVNFRQLFGIDISNITWTERSNPKHRTLSAVCWNGSLFCAVGTADAGTDAYIVTSPDGITWTERANPKDVGLYEVVWNGALFCAVGDMDGVTDAYIITSPDGITWTERANPKNKALMGLAWNGSLFCAVGGDDGVTDAYIVTSPDGTTWTERANPKNTFLYGVAWNGSLFCAVGAQDSASATDAYIVTSPDGITWTERVNPKYKSLYAVCWNGSLFCAVGTADDTDAYIITSPDGITWTERANPKNGSLASVAWNGKLFCAVGWAEVTDAYIITSPDGINWTESANPKNVNITSITWNDTFFCAVGNADGTDSYIITSQDLVTEMFGVFPASRESIGFQKLPSGMIIQWGQVIADYSDNNTTVSFPLAFPNSVFGVYVTIERSSGVNGLINAYCHTKTQSGFIIYGDNWNAGASNVTTNWFAIGY